MAIRKGDIRSLTGSLSTTTLNSDAVTLTLETLGSNQTLDLRGLGVFTFALLGDGTTDDELADIILLFETEERPDLGGALGAEALGNNGVGQTGEITLALLDDGEGHDGQIGSGDGCFGLSILHWLDVGHTGI